MTTRADVANAHRSAVSERQRLRRMLTNVTTVECVLWRGYRVALVKHDNTNHVRPHYEYLFAVLGDDQWRSPSWRVVVEPTRESGRRTRERREAVIVATMSHLLTLVERPPDTCQRCGTVITRPGSRVQFCTEACQRQGTNRKCADARKSA